MIKRLFLVLLIVAGIVLNPLIVMLLAGATGHDSRFIETWIVVDVCIYFTSFAIAVIYFCFKFIRYGSLVFLLFFAMSGCKNRFADFDAAKIDFNKYEERIKPKMDSLQNENRLIDPIPYEQRTDEQKDRYIINLIQYAKYLDTSGRKIRDMQTILSKVSTNPFQ